MLNSSSIQIIYDDSFRANLYTITHFRMIGLIDVQIAFPYHLEKVTLAFYSSSGTNSGKIKGLWYPITGIKLANGEFTEFTPILNRILSHTTHYGYAKAGWLAKSLFFSYHPQEVTMLRGFAGFPYYRKLLEIGRKLQNFYELGQFQHMPELKGASLNAHLVSEEIYAGNQKSQRENFEYFMMEIYTASKKTER